MKAIGRRAALRGLLGVTAGTAVLPWLQQGTARGADIRPPKRLVIVYYPNGVLPDEFWPSAPNGVSKLPEHLPRLLEPLEAHRSDLNVLGGLRVITNPELVTGSNGGGHASLFSLLTGRVDMGTGNYYGDDWSRKASVESLDHFVARNTSANLKYPRGLSLGVQLGGRPRYLTWSDAGQYVEPRQNPYELFDEAFDAVSKDMPASDYLLASRKSILDSVRQDLERTRRKLGREDRQRVAGHLEQVRALEKQLSVGNGGGESCQPMALSSASADNENTPVILDPNGRVAVSDNRNYPIVLKSQIDLAVMAMACDLTRVVTLAGSNCCGDSLVLSWLGAEFCPSGDVSSCGRDLDAGSSSHHALAHGSGGYEQDNPEGRRRFRAALTWQFAKLGYLLDRMKQVVEPDGTTLLDNSCVLWMSEQSDGGNHLLDGVPFLQAGKCGGAIETGRFLKWGDWNVGDVKEVNSGLHANRPLGSFIDNTALLKAVVAAMGIRDTDNLYGANELPWLVST